jgi:hypothetical protein
MNRDVLDKWRKMVKKRVESELKPVLGDNFDSVEVNTQPYGFSQNVHITVLTKEPFNEWFSDQVYGIAPDIKDTIKRTYPILFRKDRMDIGLGVSHKNHYNLTQKQDWEEKYKKMFNINENREIISEASKKNILMEKLGLNEVNADALDKMCGPLSVWMANKVIQHYVTDYSMYTDELSYKELVEVTLKKINDENRFNSRTLRNIITSMMDWIRVGLNGNLGENKELSFDILLTKSRQWHESLEIGQGEINYIEENPTLLDFTDENGNGFYWADLNTKYSEEECNRMGHCGRSSYGYLYSLRQVVPVNNKYKLNKSILTAAIGEDGILYQLKGPKNSKPNEKYHEYILPLFYVLGGGGEEDDYLIQDFGTEYASEQDFKLSDLPNETIKDLYQNRPELFESRTLQRLLGRMGIIEIEELPTRFTLELRPNYFKYYIDGGWENRYTNRKTGNVTSVSIFDEIMTGDAWELWGDHDYSDDVSGFFNYVIDKETEGLLWDIVRKIADRDGIELDNDISLEDAVYEVDNDDEIRSAIGSATNDADANDYVDYLQDLVKTALEHYGTVYEFDYEGAKIQIDLKDFVDPEETHIDEIYEDNYYGETGYKLESILDDLLEKEYIDKPRFDYDERWGPSPDHDIVNEYVRDRLNEITI